ncbi:MAG: ribonuclease Y [Clostridium sp.]
MYIYIIGYIILVPIAFYLGIKYRKNIAEAKIFSAEKEAEKIVKEAINDKENILKNSKVEAKELKLKIKEEIDKELKERRREISVQENRLFQKEEQLLKKEDKLEREIEKTEKLNLRILDKEEKIDEILKNQEEQLQVIAGLTREEAKREMIEQLEESLVIDKAKRIRKYEETLKFESGKIAREIISSAIQRCAADHTSEATVTIIEIPNDELKGRIIGKEGRNIRTLEMMTGVQFIVDDTPGAIIISAFDPIRREVAKVSLEKLIKDGRINPAKIEEIVEKTISEIEEIVVAEGNRAMLETGVDNLTIEEIKLLGKLKYRTSYSQNALTHSIEVANLSGMMAELIGADKKLATRAGLFHDIGKALDHDPEIQGTHVDLGVEFLKFNKEPREVLNAVHAHHGDVEPETVEAILVQAADTISASRPGARRDTLEAYIKRLEALENISSSFDGVKKSYAIQAGREIRIIVDPDKISDEKIIVLAHDVAEKIENEVSFPGQIKVQVLREKRTTKYAKKSKMNKYN